MSMIAFPTELLLLACSLLPVIKREHNSKELTRPYISTHNNLYILLLYQYTVCQQYRSYCSLFGGDIVVMDGVGFVCLFWVFINLVVCAFVLVCV